MKIFIGFGYNDKDEWIKEIVFPFLSSFNITILTGENIHGQILSEGVKEIINSADAVIGFLTKRDKKEDGTYTTHQWVLDELTYANSKDIPIASIRDSNVDKQNGIIGDRQRVQLDLDIESNRIQLLIQLSIVINEWKKKRKKLKLFPVDLFKDIRSQINKDDLICKYRFMNGYNETEYINSKLVIIGQSVYLVINNIPSDDSYISIYIKGDGFKWTNEYQAIEEIIQLEKQ